MIPFLVNLLMCLRPAFSNCRTFYWFVIVTLGFLARYDSMGITSIVRALHLPGNTYFSVRQFFRSSAWSYRDLLSKWLSVIAASNIAYCPDERLILIGDHTKIPKDGQKMPGVQTLHQESEASSKPSYFRGHQWAFIALLAHSASRFFALPLWGEINPEHSGHTQITHLVSHALSIVKAYRRPALLVLDAFFASKTAFAICTQSDGALDILVRGKKSTVGYIPAEPPEKGKRGPKPIYGAKLRLMELFTEDRNLFLLQSAKIYGNTEMIRMLCLDLMWKSTKSLIRFILAETSHGQIILMTSDLKMNPVSAMELYCHRYHIESFFDVFKNILGGLSYHFWSKCLEKTSRRPLKRKLQIQHSSNPEKTALTLDAIHKFVAVQIIVAGLLQLVACKHPVEVIRSARCWLRTPSGEVPSEFVTHIALKNMISSNFACVQKTWIQQFIPSRFLDSIGIGSHKEAA